jgi:hypothetical protein
MEKRSRLRKLAETKQSNREKKYKNESVIEKEMRLAQRAEEYKSKCQTKGNNDAEQSRAEEYKSKRQTKGNNDAEQSRAEEYKSKRQKKGNSLEIGNKSDANYDAKQYMVSLQHVLNNYYDY